jgi:hypothetical protein
VGPLDGVTDRLHESRARIILEKLPIWWITSEFQHSPREDSNFARKVLIAKPRASECRVRYPQTYPREKVGAFCKNWHVPRFPVGCAAPGDIAY